MADQVLDRDLSENEILAGVNDDYATKYGFADAEDYEENKKQEKNHQTKKGRVL